MMVSSVMMDLIDGWSIVMSVILSKVLSEFFSRYFIMEGMFLGKRVLTTLVRSSK